MSFRVYFLVYFKYSLIKRRKYERRKKLSLLCRFIDLDDVGVFRKYFGFYFLFIFNEGIGLVYF